MEEKIEGMKEPLRITDPELYRYIVQIFYETHNIHSYDMEALVTKEPNGLQITLRYGENYTNSKEALFTFDALQKRSEKLKHFIYDAADECKKVMVADYFKMMKP